MVAALIVMVALRALWCLGIFFGTAYYVFERGYSGWWMLLAIVLILPSATSDIRVRTTSSSRDCLK